MFQSSFIHLYYRILQHFFPFRPDFGIFFSCARGRLGQLLAVGWLLGEGLHGEPQGVDSSKNAESISRAPWRTW